MLYENSILKYYAKFTAKHLFQGSFFAEVWNVINKEILAQEFSCEFSKSFKNSFYYRTRPVAAFEIAKEYS